ncbi:MULTISPECIES: phosphodiester glycosidase family protein [unclassified Oceanispirochaeta]|uniref:phosphodiester glycosidase family protein n=1 Tax=unclassified Oceanispirochaeta TaxID=2635722 RepID=UPI000E09CB98|nr:phosphodiester glycosidase family protein [Oceanispirochaeta sp. M1]MBF9017532.1 phosphodiester glycosidase family protein [Oceanispirochaeta sp. M2]NPD74104.1 hypothetical protein [Oceanispirochaeta sp. M1]RDG30026.1 hypothetical protein DV872_18565 [Oceanispirochaeta sp. M1]
MILNNGSPFRFKELSGTSWYSRFVAEEYYILLDQYPERVIIEDKELLGIIAKTDKSYSLYREMIIDFFLKSKEKIDEYSYWDILISLRKIKRDIFGETDLINAPEQALEKSEFHKNKPSETWLESINNCMIQKNPNKKIWIQNDLKTKFDQANKILFIPWDYQHFELEISTWLNPYIDEKQIEILCFDDPLYRSITSEFALMVLEKLNIESISVQRLDPEEIEIDYFRDYITSGGSIFTTGIWPFLSLFKDISPILFAVDNSQWCSRALFQYSYDISGNSSILLKEGNYKDILIDLNGTNGISAAGCLEEPFKADIDISGVQYSATNIIDHIKGSSPLNFPEKLFENRKWISGLKEFNHVDYNSDFFKIVGEKAIQCGINEQDAVLISSVISDESSTEVKPLFFDSMTDVNEISVAGYGFLSCFNYYFTSNLVKLYNKKAPRGQELNIENFFIDYMGLFDGNVKFESLPLYKKAFLGSTKEGSLFAGHYGIEKVTMTLGAEHFEFDSDSINKEETDDSTGIYLPGFEEDTVGKGRFCIAIIQDQIIFKGTGPCRIPPVGAVIVLNEAVSIQGDTVNFSVDFKDLPVQKKDISWMIGGFNLLIDSGINNYETPEESMGSLEREGWLSTQSQQTQETQLNPEKREPRCVFGRTSQKRLILAVISGRSRISCGATFSESTKFVRELLKENEKLDFLINFDGGASASLIANDNGSCKNLSMTAPSAGNPAGIPRRLNTYFSLNIK